MVFQHRLIWITALFLIICAAGNAQERHFVPVFPDLKTAFLITNECYPKKTANGILFSYKPLKDVKSVALAGSFNGWNRTSDSLKENDGHVWTVEKKLGPGTYTYKFVVNGDEWSVDASNPALSDDGWNNSVISIDDKGNIMKYSGPVSKDNPGPYYRNFDAVKSAPWIREAVIYEVFPRVFTTNGFRGLAGKLEYLKELGVNTIWIMPVYPIGELKRKGSLGSPYSVRDYYGVNPEFGTKADFKAFVDKAHGMDFRVVLDWVPNHSAWDNSLVRDHPVWYTTNRKGEIVSPNPDWTDVAGFNYNVREMNDYMLGALKYWVQEYKIDGYRMDVAGAVPVEFWVRARSELKKLKPDIFLLAESEEEEHNARAFDLTYEGSVRNVIRDMVFGNKTQYDFYKTYNSTVYNFPKNSLRMRWLENHDQPHAVAFYGTNAVYPAATLLMTLDGVPLILMGQEFGDRKWKSWQSLFDSLQLDWDAFDKGLFGHYRKLIGIRRENGAFSSGATVIIQNDGPKAVTFLRSLGRDRFLVMANLSKKTNDIILSPDDIRSNGLAGQPTLTELLKGTDSGPVKDLAAKNFVLAPFESRIYRINGK